MSSKLMSALLAIVAVALSACREEDPPPAPPALNDINDVPKLMAHYKIPGVSVAIIRDFQIQTLTVFGVRNQNSTEPVTAETMFQAGSISKSVAAVAAMKAVQDGLLNLNDDINDRLVSWRIPDNAFTQSNKVTLRGLLSHTAGTTVHGFVGYRQSQALPSLVNILNGEHPANSAPIIVDKTPGGGFRYSGGGYMVMQQALIDLLQAPFEQTMSQSVLAPLGMIDSTYHQPLPDVYRSRASSGHFSDGQPIEGSYYNMPELAAAGLWTTPRDLANFLIELQLSMRGQSNRIISAENVLETVTPVAADYGLGFHISSVNNELYFGHGGRNVGFVAQIYAHKSLGVGAVIMTNADRGDELITRLLPLIARAERWPGY